jgi:site-specific recombinase XerD
MDPQAYRFHNLRASFAVNALRAGMHINVLQAILGHESPYMTLHYAKLAKIESTCLDNIGTDLIGDYGTQVVPNSKTGS